MEGILSFFLVPFIHLTLKTIEAVGLTSHRVKVLGSLLLTHLSKQTNTVKHPLKFTFCLEVRIEVAITHLLQWTHCYLDKADSTVRIIFFDFCSSLNTIQPALLCEKQQKTQEDAFTISWIIGYLTNRPQLVRLKGRAGGWKHRSTTGDYTLSAPLHSVHLRLPIQLKSPVFSRNTQMTLLL